MQVDLFHPPGGADPVEAAVRAAGTGFGGFWMSETSHDPFLPLAVAASRGVGIRIGTSIAVAFARSPMTLAHTTWDLAAATGGGFVLGLGSQVEAHIAGRFSMPWSAPVARMRDFVGALRAIWGAWQTGERLRYRSEHYRHVVMTPFFDPGPIDHPEVPIHLAAVGPGMARLVGEVADGIHVHPFHTEAYLDEVVRPAVAAGAAETGRDLGAIEFVVPLFVVTGPDEGSLDQAAGVVRSQIAFYGSTPAYRRVLELHGWDVGEQLNRMSRRGEWEAMAGLVTEEMLREVAVVAVHDALADAVTTRMRGRADRFGLYPAGGLDACGPEWLEVVASL